VTFSCENSLSSPRLPASTSRETRLKEWFLYCKSKRDLNIGEMKTLKTVSFSETIKEY
jgi:hypothetical protein